MRFSVLISYPSPKVKILETFKQILDRQNFGPFDQGVLKGVQNGHFWANLN